MDDGPLVGLALGFLVWLVIWRAGIRPRPARESLAFVALGLALSLLLRVLGIFNPSTSVVVGFVAAAIALTLWTRFWRVPI